MKPETEGENIFRRDIYEVLSPFQDNSKIFNHADFDIKMWAEDGRKVVLIRKKSNEETK